jgi:ankyrin repeat protein
MMSALHKSANSTPMLRLPLELLYLISYYSTSTADLNALVRCNRQLYGSLNAFLYCTDMQGSAGSALMWAAENYRSSTARHVFEACKSIEIPADYLEKALVLTLENCSWGVMKMLIANGADANTQGPGFGHILQAASWKGDIEFVRVLLTAGADIEAQAGHYGNALTAAAWCGHEEVATLLIRNRADVNAQSGSYGNALQAAASVGHQSMVRLLIKENADVNAIGGFYGSALQAACWRGDKQVVEALLQAGANPGIRGTERENALVLALKRGDTSIITRLIVWSTCHFISEKLPVFLERRLIAF